eukprot:TRINITY_DN1878_c0_g1_i1.p1 TRINITY_DN1878_c0_g1~~TRINITY_DN1878_c0_g1_i1.p1  ORF type:complete len:384 (+),score=89.02 TRINITY_DN1878_c0_g1_i1:64-1215(+)
MKAFILVAALLFGLVFLTTVFGHSEQFHRYPLHPKHLGHKPSDYDVILAALKKRQNLKGIGNESAHLKNIKKITNEGTNAEAYWSFDGKKFSFQGIFGKEGQEHPCDQIYIMNADGSNITMISEGLGRDTCSYYTPDDESVIYSSTKSGGAWCPPTPDMSYGYLWPIYNDMDVYKLHLKSGKRERITSGDYNAESTIAPDGSLIIFTSSRSGDLELYTMKLDGTAVRRITYTPGYDGGAYFSFNSKNITWRAGRPTGAALTSYMELVDLGLVEPLNMQIYVAEADGSNPVQLTNFPNVVSFSPFFLPDDSGVIFSSNLNSTTGMEFQLFMIKNDGTGLEQLTWEGTFNSFPMYSPNGKQLAWESNRDTAVYSDLNVYVADWSW